MKSFKRSQAFAFDSTLGPGGKTGESTRLKSGSWEVGNVVNFAEPASSPASSGLPVFGVFRSSASSVVRRLPDSLTIFTLLTETTGYGTLSRVTGVTGSVPKPGKRRHINTG